MHGCRYNTGLPARRAGWGVGSVIALLCLLVWFPGGSVQAASDELLAQLQQRVTDDPDSGTAWRLLGRHLLNLEQVDLAYDALSRAIELSPESAAAWHDFGRVAMARGDLQDAAEAFQIVLSLAPETPYADLAREELSGLEPDLEGSGVQTASWEIRRFDGAEVLDQLEDTDPPLRRWLPDSLTFRLETGLLFNSNVALAPVSRQLAPGDRASFQFFAAPNLQWAMFDETTWRSGASFRGRYTLNEGNFRRFNLQSFRPGWFTEWFVYRGDQLFVPRIAYDYTHDQFDGTTVGGRHGLLASVSTFWNDDHASFLYWAGDYTDFNDDGVLPSVTSQDGWLNSIGISHDVTLSYRHLHLVRAGVDVSQADTDGSDYRYRGVNLFADAVIPIVDTVEVTLQGGWGYRDFPDYEFEPSRNEVLWRGGAELRKYFGDNMSIAAICDFNRFDSRNPLFEADRLILGTVAEFEY
jgi:hypothetical protein